MKRTNVYIDGYNLYYGLLKGTPNKWLDLSCFVRALLAPDHEIGAVYYFTSIITPYPHDAAAIENQNVYLQALATDPLVRIVKGKYTRRAAHLPPTSKRCQSCDELHNGYVRILKFEEKQSDVNLAVQAGSSVAAPLRLPNGLAWTSIPASEGACQKARPKSATSVFPLGRGSRLSGGGASAFSLSRFAPCADSQRTRLFPRQRGH